MNSVPLHALENILRALCAYETDGGEKSPFWNNPNEAVSPSPHISRDEFERFSKKFKRWKRKLVHPWENFPSRNGDYFEKVIHYFNMDVIIHDVQYKFLSTNGIAISSDEKSYLTGTQRDLVLGSHGSYVGNEYGGISFLFNGYTIVMVGRKGLGPLGEVGYFAKDFLGIKEMDWHERIIPYEGRIGLRENPVFIGLGFRDNNITFPPDKYLSFSLVNMRQNKKMGNLYEAVKREVDGAKAYREQKERERIKEQEAIQAKEREQWQADERARSERERPLIEKREREARERAADEKKRAEEQALVLAEQRALEAKRQQEEAEEARKRALEEAFWNSPEGRAVKAAEHLSRIKREEAEHAAQVEIEKEEKITGMRLRVFEEERRHREELLNLHKST